MHQCHGIDHVFALGAKAARGPHAAPLAGHQCAILCTIAAGLLIAVLLYAIKAALGINVFSGHMPVLHSVLYPFIRG